MREEILQSDLLSHCQNRAGKRDIFLNSSFEIFWSLMLALTSQILTPTEFLFP
jgi:hypothetical protein